MGRLDDKVVIVTGASYELCPALKGADKNVHACLFADEHAAFMYV